MKPLRCSRTFWSGLAVLACVLGLWVDSMFRERVWVLHRGVFVESHGFLHHEGRIDLFSQRSPGAGAREAWQMEVGIIRGEEGVPWFPWPHWETKEYPTTIHHELGLPYWLIAAAVAVVWAGLLWRRRRWRGREAAVQAAMVDEASP